MSLKRVSYSFFANKQPLFCKFVLFSTWSSTFARTKTIVYSVPSSLRHWSDVPSQLRCPCIGLYVYKDYSHALMLNVPV